MSTVKQELKRDLPPLPVAALLSLGLHVIAFLLLLHGLLQVGQTTKPTQQAPLQVSLLGVKTNNKTDSATKTLSNSDKALKAPLESEYQPQKTSVATQITPIESEIAAPTVYWPRSQLSTQPQLQTTITLTYPEDFEHKQAHYETVLSVYINENGQVDRVEIEDPEFPESLAQSAISAFQAATYQPGAREHQAVKARIRIAISFDTFTAPNTQSETQSLGE